MSKTKEKKAEGKSVTISAPNMMIAEFVIVGDAPLVMNAFSKKAREQIKETQTKGHSNKKGKKREPKNFEECYQAAMHKTKEGWIGIPCTAFRKGMISACRLAGFTMTRAKLAIKVLADGFDVNDGTPLVKIIKGEPHYSEHPVRNESGVIDLRARAMWEPGWRAGVKVKYDADEFNLEDVSNLMMRLGAQVGILEGRPDSPKSAGMDWGTFILEGR